MILTSTEPEIEGYRITAYKGVVQGQTWDEFLHHAEQIGANAILNTCFDNALDVDTLFHGAGMVVEPFEGTSGARREPRCGGIAPRPWSDR